MHINSPKQTLPLIKGYENPPPVLKLGGDIARFGSAHTVIFIRCYNYLIACYRWSGVDTYQNAIKIANIIDEYESQGWIMTDAHIDVIGIGAGTVDALWNKGDRYKHLVKGINVAMKSTDKKRYRNVRSELAWSFRSRFRNHEIRALSAKLAIFGDAGIPEGIKGIQTEILERLEEQCTNLKYAVDERMGGAIYVESKEDYGKRMGGKSPDEFDAAALAFNDADLGVEKRPRGIGDHFSGSVIAR